MKHIIPITVAKAQSGVFGRLFGAIEDFVTSILDAIKGLLGVDN